MVRVGVIADTHIPNRRRQLPQEVFDIFAGVDLIFHCGDLCILSVLEELRRLAPAEAVLGNCDFLPGLPQTLQREIEGKRIAVIHEPPNFSSPRSLLKVFPAADCILFGHTHRPYEENCAGVLLFNPGALTGGMGKFRSSLGLLEIGEEIKAQVLPL